MKYNNDAKGLWLEMALDEIVDGFGGVVARHYRLLRGHNYPDQLAKLKNGSDFLFECRNVGDYILKNPTHIKWTRSRVLNKKWNTKYYTTNGRKYKQHRIECNTKRRKILVQTYANFDAESASELKKAGIEIMSLGQATWEGDQWYRTLALELEKLFRNPNNANGKT